MTDVLLDNDPLLGPKETHGPFINPRNMAYPPLELQIFALEMGCVDKNGFKSNKIKSAIKKYAASHEKASKTETARITSDEVTAYIGKTSLESIARKALEILASIPNLQATERLSAFQEGQHIYTKEDGNSTYYDPFSPLAFCVDSFKAAAESRGIEAIQLSEPLNEQINYQRTPGIELSIENICHTANYFEKAFTYFGLPDLGKEKYIEMAAHAITAHEMMHGDLHSMETSIRRKQFRDYLIANASQEDLLAIKSRFEIMSWFFNEMGQDGRETVRGYDLESRYKLKSKIRERFNQVYGETGGG